MPDWTLTTSEVLELRHVPGQVPGGKIKSTTNRRYIDPTSGTYTNAVNEFSGIPRELVGIRTTEDSYTYPSEKTRTITTRAPINRTIPGETSSGFFIAETIDETYDYNPVATSGCAGDILSATLDTVTTTTQRPLGTLSAYVKAVEDSGGSVNKFSVITVSELRKTWDYDTKGRTVTRTEELYEDPRSLAGNTVGINWATTITSGLSLTRRVVESWTEVRRGDWEYSRKEYDAWCRNDPNGIPDGTALAAQIAPILIRSESTTSTSQNQPPAAERAPAEYQETSEFQKETLDLSDPAAPFTPKERVYSWDLLPAGTGGISGGTSLYTLGFIAGKLEFARSQTVEVLSPIRDEWFTYRPYQSVRVDEANEAGAYAITDVVMMGNQTEMTVGFRGILIATLDGETPSYIWSQPANGISGNVQAQSATVVARAATNPISGNVQAQSATVVATAGT